MRPAGPCLLFAAGLSVGAVESPELDELSGLVASRSQPGVLWAHNDSGDSGRLLALSTTGRHLAEVRLSGLRPVDCEDLAIGPGPDGDLLYLGDIGDNRRRRAEVLVYRLAEPTIPAGGASVLEVDSFETLRLVYPDGARHDAEALVVDPLSSDLYILTKELAGETRLYRAAAPLLAGPTITLELAAARQLDGAASAILVPVVTAADLSPAGDALLVRTYGDVLLWERPAGASLGEAFATGQIHPLPRRLEPQGEAIAYAPDGRGYYTASEGLHPELSFFPARRPCR